MHLPFGLLTVYFFVILKRWVAILMCINMPALFIIVNATKDFLKRKKASRGVNRTGTIITSFAVSFGLMGLITFGTLWASSHGLFAEKNEETYEHRGTTLVILHSRTVYYEAVSSFRCRTLRADSAD